MPDISDYDPSAQRVTEDIPQNEYIVSDRRQNDFSIGRDSYLLKDTFNEYKSNIEFRFQTIKDDLANVKEKTDGIDGKIERECNSLYNRNAWLFSIIGIIIALAFFFAPYLVNKDDSEKIQKYVDQVQRIENTLNIP